MLLWQKVSDLIGWLQEDLESKPVDIYNRLKVELTIRTIGDSENKMDQDKWPAYWNTEVEIEETWEAKAL